MNRAMSNPFEIVGGLNTSTEDNWESIGEKDYVSFMVDRAMSYHIDTVMLASEVTQRFNMPKQWQYDFYRTAISPKKKRFSKWAKPEEVADIELIIEAYGVNRQKAMTILSCINNSNINEIRDKMSHGGK